MTNKNKTQLKKTHLFSHDKFITAIPKLQQFPENLTVIYLHNNAIGKIQNLNSAINLKVLYIHNNKITKLEGLDSLKKLEKLYLGNNEISVLEGLENLNNLVELHIEKQRLGSSDSLCFDPRTITSIAENLKVLNISYNNIKTISNLYSLKYLEKLNLNHNKLTDIKEIGHAISNWYYLREASFIGNPVTKQIHYREDIITDACNLLVLDGKLVNEATRYFMKKLKQEKLLLSSNSKKSLNGVVIKIPDVAKHYPLPIQKTISRTIFNKEKSSLSGSILNNTTQDSYKPWNALPNSIGNTTKNHFVPQFKIIQHRQKEQFFTTFPCIN